MKIKAFAASEPGARLVPFQYDCGDLADGEILVRITHCGICHSDIHLIDNDWNISEFPLVPGHEIVGVVEKKGRSVRNVEPGQRVGIGWQRSSCMACEWCVKGEENLCDFNEPVTACHHGGFADRIRISSDFAFPVPEKMVSQNVAPLLCGGITVFTPLVIYGAKPTMRVGVTGIGGLGHIALQFASAFGCEVTAFSSSADKEREAAEFGAHHFALSTDPEDMEARKSSLDMILVTATADLDWKTYLDILRPNGKLCILGAIPNPLVIPAMPLITGNKMVCGSNIGNRTMMRQMLDFAALHGIGAQVETLPMGSVNEAIERVRLNKARYRMVLVVE